jgi:hypothetical protein
MHAISNADIPSPPMPTPTPMPIFAPLDRPLSCSSDVGGGVEVGELPPGAAEPGLLDEEVVEEDSVVVEEVVVVEDSEEVVSVEEETYSTVLGVEAVSMKVVVGV